MNFDRVELDHPNDGLKILSPQEFKALSAVEKVQWIGQGRFQFFRAGVRVPPLEALKANQ
jgi:hypothetical protein